MLSSLVFYVWFLIRSYIVTCSNVIKMQYRVLTTIKHCKQIYNMHVVLKTSSNKHYVDR